MTGARNTVYGTLSFEESSCKREKISYITRGAEYQLWGVETSS